MSAITLSLPVGRSVVTEDQAREFLRGFEETLAANEGAVVETFDISCRVWKVASLNVLKDFLVKSVVPTVKFLNIDDIIASLETNTGLETIQFVTDMFREAPHLESLHANDNALGARAGEIMRPLFSLPTLKALSVNNCGMSAEVAQQLIDSMLEGKKETALTHFWMNRNAMNEEGAELVAKLLQASPNLTVFSYAGSRPGKGGTVFLARSLATLASSDVLKLTKLDLNDCTFGTGEEEGDSVDGLILTLEKCPYLDYLDLGEGGFGPEGSAKVIHAIATSGAKLKTLNLGAVDLREDEVDDGVEALVEFLQTPACADLEVLILPLNELGDEGVSMIVDALAKAGLENLKELSLDENQIEESGAQSLIDKKFPSLQKLSLKENPDIPEELAHKLFKMYPRVELDEELLPEEDVEEEADDEVDALAGELGKL